jgi:hypothetical protein
VAGDDEERRDEAVQASLPFDEPVPYRLTTAGRRLVAPGAEPALRVVDVPTRRAGGGVPTELDDLDAGDRARARALRRGGMHTLDIADQLGADPLHVEQWVADLPVPAHGRRRLRAVPSPRRHDRDEEEAALSATREAVLAAWRAAREDGHAEAVRRLAAAPALRSGLGLVAGVLDPDPHALLLGGDDVELVAAAWRWVVTTMAVGGQPVRVLVRHDPSVSADRVAHEVAAALGVEIGVVTTTRSPDRAASPPAVRVRVADPGLAGRVAGWRRALLAEVTGATGGDAHVGA